MYKSINEAAGILNISKELLYKRIHGIYKSFVIRENGKWMIDIEAVLDSQNKGKIEIDNIKYNENKDIPERNDKKDNNLQDNKENTLLREIITKLEADLEEERAKNKKLMELLENSQKLELARIASNVPRIEPTSTKIFEKIRRIFRKTKTPAE